MRNQVAKDYLLHLVPAFVLPVLFHLSDSAISLGDLFKIGLLFPLLMFAMKGLTVFFPHENLKNRSLCEMAEHATLQGLVFAAALVIILGFSKLQIETSFGAVLGQFLIVAGFMALGNFLAALHIRRKLRSSG